MTSGMPRSRMPPGISRRRPGVAMPILGRAPKPVATLWFTLPEALPARTEPKQRCSLHHPVFRRNGHKSLGRRPCPASERAVDITRRRETGTGRVREGAPVGAPCPPEPFIADHGVKGWTDPAGTGSGHPHHPNSGWCTWNMNPRHAGGHASRSHPQGFPC